MLLNFLNFKKIVKFVFLALPVTGLQAWPEQQSYEKITALARSAMVVCSSVDKIENAKLDFATNAARCLNSMASNHRVKSGENNSKNIVVSKADQEAMLSFISGMVADVVKPEKFITGKVVPKKQRTNARRAMLTLLAFAESVPVIWEAFRVGNKNDACAKTLRDVSAIAAVMHSIAATDDRYTKSVHASVLALMFYSLVKAAVLEKKSDVKENIPEPTAEKLENKEPEKKRPEDCQPEGVAIDEKPLGLDTERPEGPKSVADKDVRQVADSEGENVEGDV